MDTQVRLDDLSKGLQMLQELGFIGENEEETVMRAWDYLTVSDKRFVSGITKGLVIGLSIGKETGGKSI